MNNSNRDAPGINYMFLVSQSMKAVLSDLRIPNSSRTHESPDLQDQHELNNSRYFGAEKKLYQWTKKIEPNSKSGSRGSHFKDSVFEN